MNIQQTNTLSPKNRGNALSRRLTLASAITLGLAAFPAIAQDTDEEDVFELSPFAVSAVDETGYAATSTLAGTRLKTKLGDLPNSITVATKEFMED